MSRILRYGFIITAMVLASPPLAAQRPGSRALDTESEGAQVFLHALQRISLHHASALGDSALWQRAIEETMVGAKSAEDALFDINAELQQSLDEYWETQS